MNLNIISLSEATSELISLIENPIRENYILYQLQDQEQHWVSRYNIIKGDLWPACLHYTDFDNLQEHIKDECVKVHNFSPEIFKKSIIADADAKFCKKQQIILNKHTASLLTKYKEILTGKKVLDVACHFGHWSIFAHLNKCLNVIGADIRDDNLKVAKSIQCDLNVTDNLVDFVKADIHNYSNIENLCSDRDTILLLGIMYHVHDHFNILKAICQSSVVNVVIETGEDNEIKNLSSPLIAWKTEPTFELISGFVNTEKQILVGYPNTAWFDLAMNNLGFHRVATNTEDIYHSVQQIDQFKQQRSVHLYKRI
jgi:2-polyprenyl-3-methyl-5-hydroxy-6-metoxy-1,4-benzoquinol methylase